jgi:hypothetical protein
MTTRAYRPQCQRKLANYDVWKIRELHKWGYTRPALSAMFEASEGLIQKVLSYSTYKDVK